MFNLYHILKRPYNPPLRYSVTMPVRASRRTGRYRNSEAARARLMGHTQPIEHKARVAGDQPLAPVQTDAPTSPLVEVPCPRCYCTQEPAANYCDKCGHEMHTDYSGPFLYRVIYRTTL